jgi:hypothetical protein
MKITRLRTQIVEFPYDPPMGLSANNYLRTGSCVLIYLESDQGEVGEGLVYTFNGDRIRPTLARFSRARGPTSARWGNPASR